MDAEAQKLFFKAALGLTNLIAVLALVVFGAAGTVRYAEGWVFLGLFFAASLAITISLAQKDKALLARRTHAGPLAERSRAQKTIQAFASLSFLAVLLVPALDHRWGWSHVPLPVVVLGDLLVLAGFAVVDRVFRENTFTSAVIEAAAGQPVIDTGPYRVVRHPMYAGALMLVTGIPLALGSLVGLTTLVPFLVVIVWRLLDEESFLIDELAGYAAYRERVRWRLVPFLW